MRKAIFTFGLLVLSAYPVVSFGFSDPIETPAIKAKKATSALMLNISCSGNLCLLVGERGIILRGDFGKSDIGNISRNGSIPTQWVQVPVPVSVNLTAVTFVDERIAYAVGHDGVVLRSIDAGLSWRKVFDGLRANALILDRAKKRLERATSQSMSKSNDLAAAEFAMEDAEAGSKFGPSRPFLDLWFINPKRGWVVGSYGQIFETHDGGRRWALASQDIDNPEMKHFNGINGTSNGLLMIAAESGLVYRSTDSGKSWIKLDTGYNGHIYGVAFLAKQGQSITSYAYGFAGHVFRLDSGADEWLPVKTPYSESIVKAIPYKGSLLFVDQKGRLMILDETGASLNPVGNTEIDIVTGLAEVPGQILVSSKRGSHMINLRK